MSCATIALSVLAPLVWLAGVVWLSRCEYPPGWGWRLTWPLWCLWAAWLGWRHITGRED